MKQKFTYLLFLFTFSSLIGIGSLANAQSVTGVPSTTGCSGGGTITASSTGLGATPQYQLLLAGAVVAPVAGDASQFTNTTVFSSLASGSYTLKGRANAGGTVYTSATITVANGYTAMNVVTPTKTTPCATGTVALTTTVTGGKANYTYSIASQAAPGTALQTSAATSALTFTFNALPVGSYIVSVTDNCGSTVTSATSITQSGVLIGGILPAGLVLNRTTNGSCTSKIRLHTFYGLGYDNTGTRGASSPDKANFTWRLEFNGLSYGQDINADGNPDLAGPDFLGTTNSTTLPGGITDGATALAGNPKYILKDQCGNNVAYAPTTTMFLYRAVNCGGTGQLAIQNASLGGNLACYPINFTFTNTTNPSDVVLYSLTSSNGSVPTGFTLGKTYSISYVDATGATTGLSSTPSIFFSPTYNNYVVGTINKSGNVYDSFASFGITVYNGNPGDVINTKITASTVPATVGLTSTYTLTSTAVNNFGFTPTPYPFNTLPAGTYTVQFSGPCGTYNQTFTGIGYKGSLNSLTTTPVCGGFNVVGNTTLVEDPTFYEIIVVSGPSNVGATRTLVNTTTSQPFNGLTYGTYVFGIRVKGSTTIFNTQTVTYSAANAITVDGSNTGGYVCSAGATNGILTITAATNSPAPGNTLQYALSTDGGVTYGAYQAGNTFTGLGAGTYYFKVKDGCNNEVTRSGEIGVAASPVPSANGQTGTATFCAGATGSTITLALDVNVSSATYNWTGPAGVFSNTTTDANYKGLKNPVVAVTSLPVGTNPITCTVTLGAPCNSTSTGNLNIVIQPLPTATIAYATNLCQTGTTAVTRTGEAGGTYTALPAGLDIDATTGAINLANSIANNYTVTYTFGYVGGVPNACTNTATASVTVDPLPTATIAYPATPYYATGTVAVVQTGQAAGTYTATPAGLSINATTGAIDLGASLVGNYVVTYAFSNGGCVNTTTAPIKILSPSVTGTPSTTGCKAGGTIVAVPTGLGATPQYQLLKGGIVLAPVAGDATQFTNNATFTGLQSGTDYTLKAKSSAVGTVYTSANLTIANGYTDMALNTPTKVLTCTGGTVALTTTITGGKGDYTYSIATQAAPLTPLQTSATTSALTFTFSALPAGSYLVSVTDNCGITSTGATSITNPTVSLANIKLGSSGYVNRLVPTNCTSNFTMTNELGFRYISSGAVLSAADAALFTWKIKFQGVLYGQDTDADGFSDAAGAGFPALTNVARMPLVATRDAILADEPNTKIVLIDACGNQKEFSIVNYNKTSSYVRGQNRCGNSEVTVRIGAGMSCLPINFVFTNTTNPADVVTITQTSATQALGGFTAGATYNFTYVDGAGYTSGLYPTNSVSIPAAPQFNPVQFIFGTQQSLNNLNYGILGLNITPAQAGNAVTATVTASNNPLVNVGASVNGVIDGNFNIYLPRVNATDPVGHWPKGNYTLSIASGCSTKLINVVVQGYNASLSGYTATPICGGFNYVMVGTFDVPSAYQVIIVSAPSAGDVGQVRDLASTSASLPFNGLGPGTYVFGLRIKGGSTNVLTQTVVYNSTSVITVDRNNTGGFVCSAGATNGTLTITASSASPGAGATLQYALSTDGGVTYGAYQTGNTFAGLGAGTYYFKVKDGCNNEVTSTSQIGVAASPIASVNGITGTATFCAGSTGSTVQLGLDVNIGSATYLWTGAGLSTNPAAPNYQGLKSPVIALTDIPVGNNPYTVTITLGAPCNTTSTGSLNIIINGLPTVITNAPSAPCFPGTVDLTAAAVTAGSSAGLTYSYFTDAAGLNVLSNPAAVAVSGTYYIKGFNGSCSDIKPVTITINPLPIASISYASAPYCKRGTATVTQTGQAGGTYTSDAGLAINSLTGAVDLFNSTTGAHTVTYTFSNGSCSSSTTNTITINPTTIPTALADVNSVCSATPTAPNINDPCAGVLTATTTTVFPITTVGTTVITWLFDYGNGYTQTVNQNVIITSPAAPTVSVTEASCAIPTATITVTSPIAGLTFSKDGVDYSNTTGVFFGLTAGSAYSITAKNSTGCVSLAATGTLAPGGVAPVLVINNPSAVCAPGTVDLTSAAVTMGSTGGGVLSYWANAAGTISITDPTNISVSNTYYIKATNGACSDIKPVVITINPLPAAPVVDITQPVCGTPTGEITITAVVGETFSVDGGTYSATLTYAGLAPGNHTILAKSVDGCISAPTNITITPAKVEAVKPVVAISANPVCGTPTGEITITAVAGETYSVDGGTYSATLTYAGLAPGNHTILAKSIDGCISVPTNITIAPAKVEAVKPVVTVSAQPVCDTPTGSITITSVAGETYSVDGGTYSSTLTYAGLAPGNHTILAKSVDGCISVPTTITIAPAKVEAVKPVVTVSANPVCGTPTGSITITAVSGGTYSVDGSAYSATLIYAGLAPGNHTILAKSVDGCISAPTNITIAPAKVEAVKPVVTVSAQPVCGTPTGEITITAVAGETYSVDGGTYSATLTYAGLAPGSHTILAKSIDGCTSAPTTITIAPAKVEAVKPVVMVSANPVCGTPTGSITITAVAGETYSVDGSAYSATLIYAGLAPGNHTILAKSVDGCISVPTNITIAPAKVEAVKPLVAISAQPVCGTPTGQITITAVAGENYSVDGSAYSATLIYAGLAPGNHTILAKSIDGCISAPTNITIAPTKVEAVKPVVSISANPVCGTPTGEITITAVAGETYSVDGGTYSATLTYAGLAPGSHTILAKSIDGCISTPTNITIAPAKVEAVKPVVVISAQPVCGTPTGEITISAVAGETYSVDGSAYSATLTYAGLAPGNHTILAKSVDGCISAPTNITIAAAKVEAVKPVVVISAQPVCGTPTGVITISTVAGETYSVDGSAYSATLTYAGLAPGNHTILAKSVDGCISAPTNITIAPAKVEAIKPVVTVSANPVCGTPTGSITISAISGETYSVDGSAYSATLTYAGLASGNHTILSKSVDGCISAPTTITIAPAKVETVKPVVTVSANPVCGTPTGSITIAGVVGETYSIDGGTYSATLAYAGLAPGNHTILAKSIDGCISAPTIITINPAKVEAVKPVVAVSAQPVCGTPTGSIIITSVAGETYSVDGSAYSATLTYAGLAPGNHTILAKSVDGCISAPTTITIAPAKVEAVKPVVAISAQPVCGTPTGSITITAVAGETYSVDGGTYSATLTYAGLTPGSHSVLAKSVDGCISAATTITINPALAVPPAPTVAIVQPSCSTATGTINITAVAGNTYSVDGGAYTSTISYNLATGSHSVTTKNAAGCTSTATNITINAQPATPTANIDYGATQYQAVGTANVIRTGQAGGTYGAIPAGLSIDPTTGNINLAASTPNQTYTITYNFSNGSCTGSAITTVRISATPATIALAKASYCATGTANVIQTGPTGGTYTGSSNGLKINASTGLINLATSLPGNYVITYTYLDGTITATATTAITVNAMPALTLTSDLGTSISKGDMVTLTSTGGLTYSWTGSDIQNGQSTAVLVVRPKATTTYTVLATNASGCSDVMQLTINVKEDLKLIPNNVITPNGDGKNDVWTIKNLDYYPANKVFVYDRAGRKVFAADGYQNNWDGTYNGLPLAEAAYFYVIDMGKGHGLIRGTINIIRDNK